MASFTFRSVKIAGISACVPSKIDKNEDYDLLTEAERKQLIKTIGVSEKRIADSNTTTSDLCFQAAEKLISELNWNKNEIDGLIFASQSPDYYLPATSVLLQDRLGLPKSCIAFDINLGCSAFVYALSVAASFLHSGAVKKILILCGDKSSMSVSKTDKSTFPLFGDAGSCTALIFDESNNGIEFNLKSNGSGYKSIIIPEGGCRKPATVSSLQAEKIDKGIERNKLSLVLNGSDVFDFTLNEVLPTIKESLSLSDKSVADIDYFVFHQANLLMNETLRKLLKIPPEKMPYSLWKFGNTSSASIPLTIVTELNEQIQNRNLKLMLCGFGVGLSWGTAILETESIICPPLLEYHGNKDSA